MRFTWRPTRGPCVEPEVKGRRVPDYSAAKRSLLAQREKLVRRLLELGADESGDLRRDLDFGEGYSDAAAATAERTEILGLVETAINRLGEVDAALARIEDGSYGVCAQCGTVISPQRMEIRPVSALCVKCKSARS